MQEDAVQEQVASALFNKGIALTKLKMLDDADEVFDQLIETYLSNRNSPISQRVVDAMLRRSQNLNMLQRYPEAISGIKQILSRFGASLESETQKTVAKAILLKGDILGALHRHTEAVDANRDVTRRLRGSKEPFLREIATTALNGMGFQLLCEAKRKLLTGRTGVARKLLSKAKRTLSRALTRDPSPELLPFVLGNLGYVALLGNKESTGL